ncbi:hypothetical protein [Micromonospora sp. WMMD736]|uniref:hypothetical protein n=1 Tax=Micromonospora sp. WMMD736 TaxID=3404112 RepID=UPI003B9404C2
MADDKTIGQVSVRVVPDASKLPSEAKAELEKAEKRLPELTAKLGVELEDGAAAQAAADAKSVQEAAEAALKDITLKINVDDAGSLQTALARINRELMNLDAIELPVSLNEADLNAAKDLLQERIGQVGIDLNIDLDDNGSIERAIAKLDAELANVRADFLLNVDLNEASLEAAKDELQALLDASTAAEMRVRAELDQKQFADVVARAKALLRSEEMLLGVRLDRDKFNRTVEEIALLMKARDDINAKIGAELDPFAQLKLEQKLRTIAAQITAKVQGIHLPVEPEVTTGSKAALSAALAVITRARDIRIDLDFKGALAQAGLFFATLSTFKAFNDNLSQGRQLLAGLFTNLPNFAAATTGILAMSGAVISLTSNLIGLVGGLAQLAPLLLTVPGIAIGVATTVAALKDLPQQLPAIAEGFKGLQATISESFWAVARGPISELANKALPLISTGLEGVSGKIGGFFSALSGSLTTSLLPALPGMFGNLSESISRFSAFTPAIANIITMFGQLGSAILPPLATLVGQIATQFSAWFQQNVAGEKLNNTVTTVITTLSALFEIIKSVASIFGTLFSAAAGAGIFTALSESLGGFAETLKGLQPTLTVFFSAASQMFSVFFDTAQGGFKDAFTGITAILSSVLPTIGSILGQVVNVLGALLNDPAMVQGFSSLVGGIAAGVNALAPAIQPVAELIGALGPVLGVLATQIGQTFAALAPSFGGVLQAILPLINVLSGGFQTVLVALSPVITKLAEALAQAFSSPALMAAIDAIVNALVALMPALSPVIDVALALFNVLAGALATVLTPLAGLFTQLVPLFPMLATAFTSIFAALTPLIPMLVNLVVQILTPLIPVLLQLVEAILPLLPPVLLLVSNSLSVVMTVLQLLLAVVLPLIVFSLEGVARGFGFVAEVISAVMLPALEWVQDGIGKLQEGIAGFASWWEGIWTKIGDFFQGVWEGLIAWVKDFLGIHSPSRVFIEIAENLIAGLLNGLTAGWGKVTSFFSNALSWIKDTTLDAITAVVGYYAGLWARVTSAIGDLAGKVRSFFSAAWGKIQESLTSQWSTTSSWLVGLGGRVISAIGNVNSLLLGIGRSIMSSLWDGLKAVWGDVAGWLGGIGDKIKSLKGPEDYDAVLLVHAGELIIQGLLEGMESQYDAVRKSLSGFTSEIGGTRFGSPAVALGVSAGSYSGSGAQSAGNTLIYHAAPGNSLGAEEDLFSAVGRARAFGW